MFAMFDWLPNPIDFFFPLCLPHSRQVPVQLLRKRLSSSSSKLSGYRFFPVHKPVPVSPPCFFPPFPLLPKDDPTMQPRVTFLPVARIRFPPCSQNVFGKLEAPFFPSLPCTTTLDFFFFLGSAPPIVPMGQGSSAFRLFLSGAHFESAPRRRSRLPLDPFRISFHRVKTAVPW